MDKKIAVKPKQRPADFQVKRTDWRDVFYLVLFWSYVLIPLAWGVTATAKKVLLLLQ